MFHDMFVHKSGLGRAQDDDEAQGFCLWQGLTKFVFAVAPSCSSLDPLINSKQARYGKIYCRLLLFLTQT